MVSPDLRQPVRQSPCGLTGRGLQLVGEFSPDPAIAHSRAWREEGKRAGCIGTGPGGNFRGGGFSLLELLTVIAIISVMATLTGPVIGSIMSGRALSGAVDRAWSAVSAARQVATARQTPVALLFTADRQTNNSEKSDAFILMEAKSTPAADGSATWRWMPEGTWRKLPHGVQLIVGVDTDNPGAVGFYSSANSSLPTCYNQIANALPRLEGESISSYSFVVFRPDGSMDAPASNPFLEFKRLRAGVTNSDSALVISPDSGRGRLVQYTP